MRISIISSISEERVFRVVSHGRGKHTIKPLPKNGFGPLSPPTWDSFSPRVHTPCHFSLRASGHRPDQSHFLSPPKLALEGALHSTLPPPPQNRTTRFPHQKCRFLRSEKLQNESFPNISNFRPEFCPEFCSEFSPNFSRTFRASFHGRRRPEKIQPKSQPFFNAKSPGKHERKYSQNSSGEQAK